MAKVEKKSQTTIKLIVWSQPSSKGHQLKIRITKNRKPNYINLGYFLSKSEIRTFFPSDTLRKSYPKYKEVMKVYDEELSKLNFNKEKPEEFDADKIQSFSQFIDEYLDDLERRAQFGLKKKTNTVKFHLNNFTDNADIKFSDINLDFLEKFQTYLIEQDVSPITQKGYFDKFKSLLNKAIQKDKHYFKKFPFIGFENLRFEPVRKGLDEHEWRSIERIEKYLIDGVAVESAGGEKISEELFQTALKVKFQYYGLGMRVSDLFTLRWSNVESRGDCINYKMRKTGNPIKFKITFKMYEVLLHLLPDEYRLSIIKTVNNGKSRNMQQALIKSHVRTALIRIASSDKADEFIFNMIAHFPVKENYSKEEKRKQHRSLDYARQKYNKQLGKLQKELHITQKITSHVIRHTFALNAWLNKELDVFAISHALNHKDLKTTQSYLRGFKSVHLDDRLKNLFNDEVKTIGEVFLDERKKVDVYVEERKKEEENKVPDLMNNLSAKDKEKLLEQLLAEQK